MATEAKVKYVRTTTLRGKCLLLTTSEQLSNQIAGAKRKECEENQRATYFLFSEVLPIA